MIGVGAPRAAVLLAHAGGSDEIVASVFVFVAFLSGWIGWRRVKGRGYDRLPVAAARGLLLLTPVLLVVAVTVPRAMLGPDRPASPARIAIAEPERGAQLPASEVAPVRIELDGAQIVSETSEDLDPGEGHIHLTLDGELLSMTYDTGTAVALPALDPGPHRLEAEFVASDHAPFSPRVQARTEFEVLP